MRPRTHQLEAVRQVQLLHQSPQAWHFTPVADHHQASPAPLDTGKGAQENVNPLDRFETRHAERYLLLPGQPQHLPRPVPLLRREAPLLDAVGYHRNLAGREAQPLHHHPFQRLADRQHLITVVQSPADHHSVEIGPGELVDVTSQNTYHNRQPEEPCQENGGKAVRIGPETQHHVRSLPPHRTAVLSDEGQKHERTVQEPEQLRNDEEAWMAYLQAVDMIHDGNFRIESPRPPLEKARKIRYRGHYGNPVSQRQLLDLFLDIHPPVNLEPVGKDARGQQDFDSHNGGSRRVTYSGEPEDGRHEGIGDTLGTAGSPPISAGSGYPAVPSRTDDPTSC